MLNNQERLRMYEHTLYYFQSRFYLVKKGVCEIMMKYLEYNHEEEWKEIIFVDIESWAPEFYKQKPLGASRTSYWWPFEDKESRINAIKKSIKLLNDE